MNSQAHILTAAILCIHLNVTAQTDSAGHLERMIEQYSESMGYDPDDEEITQYLSSRRKININRLDPSDLSGIPFLTPRQIKNLTVYLKTYGEVYSMFELLGIEGFDTSLVRLLIPYLEAGPVPDNAGVTPRSLLRNGKHELVVRWARVMQRQAGYEATDQELPPGTGSIYQGNPQRYYFRYRYSYGNRIISGFSGEKDAGEEFFGGSQQAGMDFYSGFISVQNMRWLKQITLGHFRVSFGQGLTLGGNSFGRQVSFGTQFQYRDGFRPTQSVTEYGFLRGGAITVQAGGFEASLFGSLIKRDATVDPGDSGGTANQVFSSFCETGYHRTIAELQNRKRISERVAGGRLSYRGRFFIAGITGYYGIWGGTYETGGDVYRKFGPAGSRFAALGIDGRCRIGFAQLFGEISVSLNGRRAWLAGLWAVPVPGLDLLLVCRNYHPGYQNPFGMALGQGGSACNEQGIFVRIQSQQVAMTTLTGYLDLFRFPWLRYRINGPSTGVEAGIMVQFRPSPSFSALASYTLRRGEINGPVEDLRTTPLVNERRDDLKVQAEIVLNSRLSMKTRLMYRTYCQADFESQNGYLANQEVSYRTSGLLKAIRVSYALFDIPGYGARLYFREPDLLYSWSSYMCHGRGFRCCCMIQAGIARCLEVAAWIGGTIYTDREKIGSGPEEIEGNVRSEIRIQMRLKL